MRKLCILLVVLSIQPISFSFADDQTTLQASKSWTNRFIPEGDIRIRYETINEVAKTDIERETLQVRLGAKAKISDSLDSIVRIATDEKKDPTSRSMVLDHKFTMDNLIVDQVYLDWHPSFVRDFHLIPGRVPNAFIKPSDLFWDNDLKFDGLSITKTNRFDTYELNFNSGAYLMDQRESETDITLYGVQVGSKMKSNLGFHKLSFGFFSYAGMEDHTVTFSDLKSYGNSTYNGANSDEKLLYSNDYQIFNVNGEAIVDAGIPIAVYFDFIDNVAVVDDKLGYMLGIRVGSADKKGDYTFNYNYRMLQKDCAVGKFSDSDSFGGGTDGKGSKLSSEFYLTDHIKFQVSYFGQEKGIDTDSEKSYRRLQVDLSAKL